MVEAGGPSHLNVFFFQLIPPGKEKACKMGSPSPVRQLASLAMAFLSSALLVLLAGTVGIASAANLTDVLSKGGQYSTFMRLLRSTQAEGQIQSQLNNSFNGLTVLAPTDNAFSNLKAGTLNALSPQQQVTLVLFHLLPRYYTESTFETASNPLQTQASGPDGVYTFNISSTTNQVNITTGVVETPINNALYSDFPLAVFSVDKVLLPSELFGAKPPTTAAVPPSPLPAKENPKSGKAAAAAVADAPSIAASQPSAAAGLAAGAAAIWSVALAVGFVRIW